MTNQLNRDNTGRSRSSKRRVWRGAFAVTLAVVLLGILPATRGGAAPSIIQGTGPNAADIQPFVDSFRTALGGLNNGVGGSFETGRREINWDGVPDANSAPNFLDPKFFNVTSPRGAVFSTVETNGNSLNDFIVSADSSNPTATPTEFGDIDASYPATFKPFSSPRMFTPRGTNIMQVNFFVPGTQIPATVSGFGAVFSDVDVSTGARAAVTRVYDADGDQLAAFTPSATSNGLSFAGITFNAGERIARVTIQTGNVPLASGKVDSVATDVVAMDDFIYGEPRAMEDHVGDFDADGGSDLTVFRPSEGVWYTTVSGTGTVRSTAWGTNGDIPVAADYDGDSKLDLAVFRPSDGFWHLKRSTAGNQSTAFGTTGDIPAPADYDKDGKADLAVFRPSSGTWFILQSSNSTVVTKLWGGSGDIPVPKA